MNMNQNPTTEQLAALLRTARDDEGHHQIWVDVDGIVRMETFLGRAPAFLTDRSKVQFRLESLAQGNGYVGEDGADDAASVSALFRRLVSAWSDGRRGLVDY